MKQRVMKRKLQSDKKRSIPKTRSLKISCRLGPSQVPARDDLQKVCRLVVSWAFELGEECVSGWKNEWLVLLASSLKLTGGMSL